MKSSTPEMARFNDALRSVMTVTKPELTALLHDEKAIEAVPEIVKAAGQGRNLRGLRRSC